MRYALVSDIHGNYPALKSVMEDIAIQGVDQVIFLGDYFGNLAYPNKVVDLICECRNAMVIRGNWEDYLNGVKEPRSEERKYQQFSSLVWNVDKLTPKNYSYLCKLPQKLEITDDNSKHRILFVHAITDIYKDTSLDSIRSSSFAEKFKHKQITRVEFINDLIEGIGADDNLKCQIYTSDYDIYVFGHSHIQLNFIVGDKMFINPGSCGFAFDGDNRAAYSILSIGEDGLVNVIDRRVEYSISDAINHTRNCSNYNDAKHWYEVMFTMLRHGTDELTFLFRHVEKVADESGESSFPFSNKVWVKAMNSWNGFIEA